jgi:L-fuconolactonase
MDRFNIDITVLVQCMYHGYDNSYMCHCMDRYPDRLRGVALIDPKKTDAPSIMERLFKDHRVQGLRLYPISDEDASWLSAEDQVPLWEMARSLGASFIWFGTCAQIPLLEPMLERFPDVKIIIDHLGEPVLEEGIDGSFQNLLKASKHPGVFIKSTRIDGISGEPWPFTNLHAWVKAVYESYGAQRMLGCTGFMNNPPGDDALGFRVIEEAFPFFTAEDKEWILGNTVASIYDC